MIKWEVEDGVGKGRDGSTDVDHPDQNVDVL
jgi:hypothetical protein